MSFADDYFNELNKKKKKKQSYNSDNGVTAKNDYASEYFAALNEAPSPRTTSLFSDDIAPVSFDEYKERPKTIETTQAIYDKYGKYYHLPDYDEYSKKGADIENPTFNEAEGLNLFGWRPFSKEVSNIVTYSRDNVAEIAMGELQNASMVGKSKYRHMTDFEVGIYNYLLAKEGEKSAQEYLDDIEETLNARVGGQIAEKIQALDPVSSAIMHGTMSVGAGVDSFGTGVKQLFSEEALPTTATAFANEELLNDLDGFEKLLYQSGNTVGNMAPSVAVGFLNPTLGMATQGASAAGGAYGQARKEGYSKEEAATYGVIIGGMEFATSKLLSGVSGMTGKLPEKAMSKIATFENGLLRTGAKYGISVASEITEEEVQLWLEPFVRTIAFGEDYDAPAIEEMAETAIVTALSTGMLNSTTDIATGQLTKVNGLTQHEAKVIEAEVENRIAEKEKSGKKLSSKEKEKIYNDVVEQMDKGQLDIDTIESVLGGETYKTYKNLTEQENTLQSQKTAVESEISDLIKTPETQFTIEQRERLNSLREEARGIEDNIKALDTKTAKTNLFNEVNKLTEKDTRLRESYNERARRGQAFEADLTKYKGKQRDAIQRAIDSGVLNNTNRSHELVNTLSKIEADKGIVFDYTNNEKLKESGFALEGKTVNGFVKDGSVTLNVQSAKAWQSTVGHEITHVLEGTEAYSALREAVYAYAESKGELASRKTALTELYNGMNADIDAELTADLVGDYLFTDKDFINKLTGNRTLFQKVWDEVKYLCKVATGKELTEIEKVEREFARAWKEQGQSEESGEVKYSISTDSEGKQLSKEQSEYFKDSKVVDENGNLKVMYHGSPNADFTVFKSGTYFTEHKWYADLYQNQGASSLGYKKTANNPDTYAVYLDIKKPFDTRNKAERDIFYNEYYRQWGTGTDLMESGLPDWMDGQDLQEFLEEKGYDYDGLILDEGGVGGYGEEVTSRGLSYVVFSPEQVKNIDNAKPTADPDIRYSISKETDAEYMLAVENGDMETAQRLVNEAAEKSGYKIEAYHGTPNTEFTVFDKDRVGKGNDQYGAGFYFASNKTGASYYGNRVIDVVLNIKKPIRITATSGSGRSLIDANIELTSKQAYEVVKRHPDMYDEENSPLGDYFDSYWESGAEEWMIESLAEQYRNVGYLDSDLFRNYPNELHEALRDVTGYDGIEVTFENTGDKFYIAWFDNQMKSIDAVTYDDNQNVIPLSQRFDSSKVDIRNSLSYEGEQFAPTGNYSTPLNETALEQDIAPVATDEKTVPVVAEQDMFPSEISPVDEKAQLESRIEVVSAEKETLKNEFEQLYRQYAQQIITSEELQARRAELEPKYKKAAQEYDSLIDRISSIENAEKAQQKEFFDGIREDDIPPEAEAPYYGEEAEPANPFENRDIKAVGNQKVKAYMYENPEVKPFFQEEAGRMLGELNNTQKGERWYNRDAYDYGYGADVPKVYGVSRQTSADIAYLLDDLHYSYDQIRKGLNAIIEDNGEENNAVSKRIEFLLNDRLLNGYQDMLDGYEYPPNQDYVNLLNEKQITEYNEEAFKRFMENPSYLDDIAPVVEGVAENATTTRAEDVTAPFPDAISPMTAEEANALQDEKAKADAKLEGDPKTRKQLHNNIINDIKATFSSGGYDFDDTLAKAKDLSTFSTVDNTPQRVMEKALGYKEGQVLADLTVNKVAQNETKGIKWLNSFTDRKNGLLAQISKEYNIKPGSKKSAAAQMYAEGFYVDENNEIVEYGDRELAIDFPKENVRNNIKGLAKDPRIRQIYDATLDAINKSRIRNAYPEIQKLDNYFLHFRAMEDTFSKLGLPFNPNDIKAKDLPTDLNGVTADLKPGQPYFASAMHRKGKRTSFDLLGGLERYLTSAKNQIYHIDDIQTLRAVRNYIADTYGQANGLEGIDALTEEEAQERIEQVYGSHLSTFAKFLNEEANILAGKTALIDRGLEGVIGRRGMTFLDTVRKQTGSNMVGFNVSSSLTNFLPVAQTLAKSNKFDFLKAFTQTASNKLGSIFGKGDNFAENSPVMIRRKGADKFHRTLFQKISDTGYFLMGAVDNISTELIARTKFNELTRKGMSEQQAHIETDKWVSRLMGDRSLGQMPQLYNSKTLGFITQFQLEVRNQLDSQFYDTIQEAKVSNEEIENNLARNAKTAAKVTSTFVQLAVVQHLFGKAFESVAGYNPAFDIIEVLSTMFGFDDEEDDEDTVLDNLSQGFLELLEDLPYTSAFTGGGRIPMSSALPISEVITGKDSYGNEKSRLETLGETIPYFLPGGYGQIKKTTQGLGMFSDEHPIAGSYTDKGNLRFPVEDTPLNRIQAGIFGQYANANAREYFDNDYAPLKEKQIQEYIDVDLPIADYWKYREGLSKLQPLEGKESVTLNQKGDYIGGLDLPVSKKNILINNIADDRKTPIDFTGYENYADFEEFDFAQRFPEKYAVLKEQGISVADYKEKYEETAFMYTDDFAWASNNPERYALSKVVTNDVTEYKRYTTDLYNIKADKDENGKSINGSRKEKVLDYINNLDADYEAKIILWKSEYPSDDTYNMDIINYINERGDLTYEERIAIFTELGFTVENGTVYW